MCMPGSGAGLNRAHASGRYLQENHCNSAHSLTHSDKLMIFSKKLFPPIALATSMTLAMAASPTIHAETATATLQVTAGLRAAMSLSCPTALTFGWTTLDTVAAVTLSMDTAGTLSVPEATTGVTVGVGAAGECTITGVDPTQGNIDIVISGTTTMSGGVVDGSAAPTSELALVFGTVLDADSVAVTDGSATFKIGGTLTIPASVVTANLGGYTAERTVTVTDAI